MEYQFIAVESNQNQNQQGSSQDTLKECREIYPQCFERRELKLLKEVKQIDQDIVELQQLEQEKDREKQEKEYWKGKYQRILQQLFSQKFNGNIKNVKKQLQLQQKQLREKEKIKKELEVQLNDINEQLEELKLNQEQFEDMCQLFEE